MIDNPVEVLAAVEHVRNQSPFALLVIFRDVVLESLETSANTNHSDVSPELAIAPIRANEVQRTRNEHNRNSNIAILNLATNLKIQKLISPRNKLEGSSLKQGITRSLNLGLHHLFFVHFFNAIEAIGLHDSYILVLVIVTRFIYWNCTDVIYFVV